MIKTRINGTSAGGKFVENDFVRSSNRAPHTLFSPKKIIVLIGIITVKFVR